LAIKAAELRSPDGGVLRNLHTKPLLGLLALAVPLAWKPVAHAMSVISHTWMHGPTLVLVSTLLTLLGFVVVWLGLKKDELTGTLFGFMGGALIFAFGVEPSFALFAWLMDVQPLKHAGNLVLTPNLVLMEASLAVYLIVLIFTGANKDTRCRMFLWFHRNFRLRPNKPTPGYRRQFARIAAMETVFISWFFYLVIIVAVDPRVLGLHHPGTYLLSACILLWGIYLVVFKMIKYRAIGGAIRYAIAVSGVIWYSVEMGALWDWFDEIWIQPIEHPFWNLSFLVAFLVTMFLANSTDARGASASD